MDRPPALFGEHLLQRFAIVEVRGRMNLPWQILLVQIDLLEQRGEELARVEFFQVLPEELAPVQHAAAAQVKKVDGHQRAFLVETQDVRPPRPYSSAAKKAARGQAPHKDYERLRPTLASAVRTLLTGKWVPGSETSGRLYEPYLANSLASHFWSPSVYLISQAG